MGARGDEHSVMTTTVCRTIVVSLESDTSIMRYTDSDKNDQEKNLASMSVVWAPSTTTDQAVAMAGMVPVVRSVDIQGMNALSTECMGGKRGGENRFKTKTV
jgi:hypothetical protein